MSFCFILNCSQTTRTICASPKLGSRSPTSPSINDYNLKYPYNINEVPILNCEVHCGRLPRFSHGDKPVTNSQIKPSYKNVKTMKSSCQIKCTSENRVTESKGCSSILLILTIQKHYPKPNSGSQMNADSVHVPGIYCVFCSVCGKITP